MSPAATSVSETVESTCTMSRSFKGLKKVIEFVEVLIHDMDRTHYMYVAAVVSRKSSRSPLNTAPDPLKWHCSKFVRTHTRVANDRNACSHKYHPSKHRSTPCRRALLSVGVTVRSVAHCLFKNFISDYWSGDTGDACGEFLRYSIFTCIVPLEVGMVLEVSSMKAVFCGKTVDSGAMSDMVLSEAVATKVVWKMGAEK